MLASLVIRSHIKCLSILLTSLFCAFTSVKAQEVFFNQGETVFISTGDTFAVLGNGVIAAAGNLDNQGVVVFRGDWETLGKTISTGTFIFDGTTTRTYAADQDTHSIFRINESLELDVGRVIVTNSLQLGNERLVLDPTSSVRLTSAAGFTTAGLGHVDGAVELETPRAQVIFPVGYNNEPLFVQFTGYSSTSPTSRISAQILPGPAPNGDSLGIANLSTYRFVEVNVLDGTGADADAISLTTGASDPALTSSTVVGQAKPGTSFISIEQGSLSLGPPDVITSDSIWAGVEGRYILGECRHIAGIASALDYLICEGEPGVLELNGQDSGADIQWQISSDGVNFSPITGATAQTYTEPFILDQSYFRALVSNGGCEAATSSIAMIDVNPALKLKLRVLLEGPYGYDTPGQHISLANGLNKPALLILNNKYLSTGSAIDTLMNPGISIQDSAVDVVAIEIWKDADLNGFPEVFVERTFGWVNTKGYVTDFYTGGQLDYLRFCGLTADQYFVVVKHRNHLPVMTAISNLIDTNEPSAYLDLSQLTNLYNAEAVQVEPGVYAMPAGNVFDFQPFDVNEINAMDFFFVSDDNGVLSNGFYITDLNLDGNVNATDYLKVQKNNNELFRSSAPVYVP